MDRSSSPADGGERSLRLIKPYYELLNDLSKDVDEDYLQELCTLSQSLKIPDEKFECDTPLELFRKLDKYGSIGEDKTGFLKEILQAASHNAGVEMVEWYEKERQEHLESVAALLKENDPLFVGRTAFVRKILEVFQDSHSTGCRCVLVYGLAGTGKTKLAVESCALYKKQQTGSLTRLVKVNLHKATSNSEVWLWAFRSLTGKQISFNQFEISLFKNWVLNCEQDTIVYLDNADAILNSSSGSKKEFIRTLSDILGLKNNLVKILITSRHPVDVKGPSDIPHFAEIKLEPLTEKESIVLLRKMVTRDTDSGAPITDESSLVEIARLCGWNPQALRAVASRLRSNFKPKELAEHLKKFELIERVLEPGFMSASTTFQGIEEGQQMVLKSLNAMFEQLEEPLKRALLKLTVFPASFTSKQAATILDHEDAKAKYDLDDLETLSLVEKDQLGVFETGRVGNEPCHYVHPLVRFVCLTKVQSSQANRDDYEVALRRFIEFVNGLMKTLTKLGHRDFPKAQAEYEQNTTNVLHFLEIDMGRKFDSKSTGGQQDLQESLPRPNTREELYSMLQTFLDPMKRLEYYDIKSEQMLAENEVVGWAYFKGWVGDEQVTLAQYSNALKTIEEPLKRVRSGTLTVDSERAKAKLLYVKGRIRSENEEFSEAIILLEEALSIHQRLLGAHTVTARCLNALGHAYYNKAEESRVETGAKALEYHQKAWDMLKKITNGHPKKHFDAPEYLLNIGASYHQAGKNSCHEKKADKLYRRAIKTYEEALELAESLKLMKLPSTAYMLKNIAMSYYEMGEYEKALPRATEAGQIREATCRLHPATARNLYFIGTLHEKIGDQLSKAGKTQESGDHLREGLEYFKKALNVEFKLEKHSTEYFHLKKDTIELMEKLHMDKDIEKYRLRFQREDEKAGCSTNEQTSTSYNEDIVEISMHHHLIGTDDADSQGDEAGASKTRKGKTPGPVMLEESPNKICKCC
ncbi:uncharacterized protein [Asterias amurensis]|uniref:uncharacterized protein n=1 Tax=Asterias amurensis TaxID=7602 RepID=UPI003AB8FA3A